MAETTIAVVGNPNSGKTTLFNSLTGGTQRVGNWPGVTVEKKVGYFNYEGTKINVVDLPGIYALSASSEDERIALEYILTGEMDLILNIIDGTNLERNLYLTFQLLEMRIPMIVVVNMLDIAENRNIRIDLTELSKKLGCPVYGITATNKSDTDNLKKNILLQANKKSISEVNVPYPLEISQWVDGHTEKFAKTAKQYRADGRWVALQVLENNQIILDSLKANGEATEKTLSESILCVDFADTPEILIAEGRYQYLHGIAETVTKAPEDRSTMSDKVDSLVLNRILGIPIFLVMMYLVFWVTLVIGGAFIDFFDIAFGAIFVDGFGVLLESIGTPGWLVTILASGVGAGIQTVSTFVPIVFVMFLCLSILEDSGYMARAAFVMDRFMRAIGLPGKSFVPMLVGFGCTVPAIMATRTLESTRDRILTTFMAPFMSCGARLPVYALFGAAFFGAGAGMMVFSIYLAGGVLAVLTGLLMKNTLLKGKPSHFIMELPPYHAPRPGSILRHAWNRTKSFMFRAGKVIIIAVALLGFLNSIGTDGSFGNEDADNSVLSVIGKSITPIFEPMGVHEDNWPATVALFTGLFAKEAVVGTLNSLYAQIELPEGYVADEPEMDEADEMMADEMTDEMEGDEMADGEEEEGEEEEEEFSLSASLAEAFQTIPENLMGIVDGLLDPFGVGIIGEDEATTAEEVGADESIFASMRAYFNEGPVQIYAYLLFILLYVPCLAAMGAVVREIGGKLAIVLALYLTLLAWIVSTLVYQIGFAHEPVWIIMPLVMLAIIAFALRMMGQSDMVKKIQ